MLKSGSPSKDKCSTPKCSVWQQELDENICLECTNILSSLMQFSTRKAKNKRISQQGSQREGRERDNVEQSTETSELPQAAAGEKLRPSARPNLLQDSSCSSIGLFQHSVQHQESLLQLTRESTVAKSPSPSKLRLNNKTEELQRTADDANKLSTDSTCTKLEDDEPFTHSSPVRETRSSVGSGSPTDSETHLSPSPIHLPRDTSLTEDDTESPKLNLTQSPLQLSPKRTSPRLKLFKDTAEDSTSSTITSLKTLKDHELEKAVNSSLTKDHTFEDAPDQPTPDMSDSDSWVSTSSHDISFSAEYFDGKVTAPQNSPILSEEATDRQSSIDENSERALKGILKSDESPSPRTARNIKFDPVKSIRLIFDEESSSEDEKSNNESQNNGSQQKNVAILTTNITIKSKNVANDILDGSLNCNVETESSEHTEKVTVSLSSNKNTRRSSRTNGNFKRKIQDFHDSLHTDEVVTDKLCEGTNDDATLDLKPPSIADKDLLKSSADANKNPSNTRNASPTKPILKAKRRHPVKNLGLRNVKSKINVSDSSGQSSLKSLVDSENLPSSKRKSRRSIPQAKAPECNELSKLDQMSDDGNLVASKCEPDLLKPMLGSEYVVSSKDLGYVKGGIQKLTSHIFRSYVDMGVRCDEMLPSVTLADDKKSVPSTKTKRKIIDSHISSKIKKRKY
ncbi:hypothetical protein B566_EDAN010062 [Ephemera danica]|nr:hypothetical protein B566_EDAN010062 [Ephemera danica]